AASIRSSRNRRSARSLSMTACRSGFGSERNAVQKTSAVAAAASSRRDATGRQHLDQAAPCGAGIRASNRSNRTRTDPIESRRAGGDGAVVDDVELAEIRELPDVRAGVEAAHVALVRLAGV